MANPSFVEFEVKGLKELEEAMKRLPDNLQKKVLQRGVLAAASVIRDEARALCPKKTGQLSKSIVARKLRLRAGEKGVIYQVGMTSKGFYGHMVEYGTAPHVIRAKSQNKMLKFGIDKRGRAYSRWINIDYAYKVSHPGAAPHPFLRPALDTKSKEAIEKMRLTILRAVERGEVVYWKNLKGW